ncbi:MAG: pilus assembly protein PilP [Pseudohongiellaceae bacterium]|nr:pilus assembly protein PilP [Pseudohongiellaceae bacterium]
MLLTNLPRSNMSLVPRLFALVSMAFVVAACSPSNEMSDLQQFIVEVSNRPGGPIEPMPTIIPYEPFTYSAASLRSPFDIPIMAGTGVAAVPSQEVQPDFEREQEELEQFNLATLYMVGVMRSRNSSLALIRDENGKVHRVGRGSYMGRNHGRVVSITPTEIELIEIVPAGDGGWVERPRTLVLQK